MLNPVARNTGNLFHKAPVIVPQNEGIMSSLMGKACYLSPIAVVVATAFGLIQRSFTEMPSTFRSSAVCRAGFQNGVLNSINQATQSYVMNAPVKLALPIIGALGVPLAFASIRTLIFAVSGDKKITVFQKAQNELAQLPWKRITLAVGIVALTSISAVTQTWWVAALPTLLTLGQDDPSGHLATQFTLGLALGVASSAVNRLKTVNNGDLGKTVIAGAASVALTTLSLALTVGNAVNITNTATNCHTELELYAGLIWAASVTTIAVAPAAIHHVYCKVFG